MSVRKVPKYDELLIEYNELIEQLKLDKKEAVVILMNKYDCSEKTICRGIKIAQQQWKDNIIPIWWTKEFTNEWNAITERLISGKHTIIIKKPDYKVIPAADIPKGFLF